MLEVLEGTMWGGQNGCHRGKNETGKPAKGWLAEISDQVGILREGRFWQEGICVLQKWSAVPGRSRVSQLSPLTFAHRPNINATLVTRLT